MGIFFNRKNIPAKKLFYRCEVIDYDNNRLAAIQKS